jgi:CRISPR-associated protein Cas1
MLNYAYAILENRVRSEIVANGYDPMIGYLHSYSKDRAAFVFDLMEPLRPKVDRVILGLFDRKRLNVPILRSGAMGCAG